MCGIFGSIVLEHYGWQLTFHLIGFLTFIWVLYYHFNVVKPYRKKMQTYSIKDSTKVNDMNGPANVPWCDIMTQPAFW